MAGEIHRLEADLARQALDLEDVMKSVALIEEVEDGEAANPITLTLSLIRIAGDGEADC